MASGPDPNSPYAGLPQRAFWRTGIVGQAPDSIGGLYVRKFPIDRSTQIAAAGSCFAQHIARYLKARGFAVIDAEPAPPGLAPEAAAQFGFGLFSGRYANIYTARQLRQITEEAFKRFKPSDPVWEKDGRFYDAMRPSVEPKGLATRDLVLEHRKFHLRRIGHIIRTADLFVFTLGLTEAWVHARTGTTYPTAPGTIAGRYDPDVHVFKNFTFQETYDDMRAFFDLAQEINPKIRFLLTVSPVPLTATASGDHVLAATVYSKSVLRAVAGQLCQERRDVDYFPSYEIITSALSRGAYFEDNLRSVRAAGVAAAMKTFLAQHDDGSAPEQTEPPSRAERPRALKSREDEICEDVLLDAFAR